MTPEMQAVFDAKREQIGDDQERLAKLEAIESKYRSRHLDKIHLGGAIGGVESPKDKPTKREKYTKMVAEIGERKNWTDEQYAKANKIIAQFVADDEDVTEEIRGFAGLPAEAMTAGILGDEARAAGRAVVAKAADFIGGTDYAGSFKEEYELALEDERRVEAETYRDFPLLANATTIGFGLLPAAKVAQAVGVGKTAIGGAARQGSAAAAEAGLYGFMEGENLDERIEQAQSYGTLGGVLGGATGAIGGRLAGNRARTEQGIRQQRELMEAEQQRLVSGTAREDLDDALAVVKQEMDQRALSHYQQTGTELVGQPYMQAIREVSEQTGIPLRRIRQAEQFHKGTVLDYEGKTAEDLIQKLDDFVPGEVSRAQTRWYKSLYENGLSAIVKKAERRVGKSFAGRLQTYATKLAQSGDEITTLFRSPEVSAFSRAMQNDSNRDLRTALLNMGNVNRTARTRKGFEDQVVKRLKALEGDEAVKGFRMIQAAIRQQQRRNTKFVNGFLEEDPYLWPSQVKSTVVGVKGESGATRAAQMNAKLQERGLLRPDQAALYENPVVIADEWLRTSRATSEFMDHFGLRNLKATRVIKARETGKPIKPKSIKRAQEEMASGHHLFKELDERLKLEGADELTRTTAQDIARSVVVKGAQGPSSLISNFRKAAYVGTIGNPYSAVLNVGDTFNAMVNFGVENTANGVADMFRKNGLRVTVDDIGLMNQTTGEFIRDGVGKAQRVFDAYSEGAFRVSGFRAGDRFGKNVAISSALRSNRELASKGLDAFRKRWEGVFSPTETKRLFQDVLKDNSDSQLVKEMAAAELSRMQPTDLASLPQWFLDHPNARVFYMLRTFGLKQLQQIEDLVINQWKAGNKKEAIRGALAYTIIAGGGNAALMEGRQILKGDAPTPEGYGMKFAEHMLGAASANTLSLYTLGRSINEGNPVHVASGALPPIGLVFAPMIDLGQIAQSEDVDLQEALKESEMMAWAPWGRLAQDWLGD